MNTTISRTDLLEDTALLYRCPPADELEEILLAWNEDLAEVFSEETNR